jgi:hypothetical protein
MMPEGMTAKRGVVYGTPSATNALPGPEDQPGGMRWRRSDKTGPVVGTNQVSGADARRFLGLRAGSDTGTATESAEGKASRIQRRGMRERSYRGGAEKQRAREEAAEARQGMIKFRAGEAALDRQRDVDVAEKEAGGAQKFVPQDIPLRDADNKVLKDNNNKVQTTTIMVDQATGLPAEQDLSPDDELAWMVQSLEEYKDLNRGWIPGNWKGKDKPIDDEVTRRETEIAALRDSISTRKQKGAKPVNTTFASKKEAMAAKLPKGTRVTVNGRPAIIE